MEARGISMLQLAEELGIPASTVRIWHLRGKVPNDAVREKLSKPPYAPKR